MPKGSRAFIAIVVADRPALGPSLAAAADGPGYSQAPEIVMAETVGADAASGRMTEKPIDVGLGRGPSPSWIWGADENSRYFLKTTFEGGSVAARLKATCDNQMTIFLNGKQVATSDEWQEPIEADVQPQIRPGRNELVAEVTNQGSAAGFLCKLALKQADGQIRYVISDASWTVASRRRFTEHRARPDHRTAGAGPLGRRLQPARDPRLEARGVRGSARFPG